VPHALPAPLDAAWYKSVTGVPPLGGEQAYTPIDRTAFRPVIDLNGIHSGYGGVGSKTIIPARAEAKISARLVPGQQPERILEAIVAHLQRHVPAGLRLDITERAIIR
jgi:acetylornithine deacetylase/succinyl-diaminopimelate desuccinylase-like protein